MFAKRKSLSVWILSERVRYVCVSYPSILIYFMCTVCWLLNFFKLLSCFKKSIPFFYLSLNKCSYCYCACVWIWKLKLLVRTCKIWSPRNQSLWLLLTVWSIFLSDDFLFYREKYGRVTVRVDYGKKENRNRPADDLTLSEFLAIYNDSDRYLVDTLPKEMWDEFFLPNCLLCGGFTTRLQVRNDRYH